MEMFYLMHKRTKRWKQHKNRIRSINVYGWISEGRGGEKLFIDLKTCLGHLSTYWDNHDVDMVKINEITCCDVNEACRNRQVES